VLQLRGGSIGLSGWKQPHIERLVRYEALGTLSIDFSGRSTVLQDCDRFVFDTLKLAQTLLAEI
jgi:hypothetical protein